ncbi:hypothetical protein [Streptomyces sp. NPDC029554]|uniref:hypothetical protein n=1 Tax=Streptomyces sp. NPDC029554 TaxID=3155126 RepID=UPI0034110AC6
MRTTHASTTAGRTLARVLKAVLSLLILVGTVVGLPLLLAWATPAIWDASHDDLTHLLDRQDTGAAFLVLLLAVGWLGWAQFTFCAAAELVAQVRGLSWRAPRGLGASQRAAAALIGSILVLLPANSALADEAKAVPSATAGHVPGQAQAPTAADGEQPAASSASAPRTYTVRDVRPAESLWSIAERELGDGERWREIAALNEGRLMADGQAFRSSSFLQPGWQLRMPASATATAGTRTQLDEAPQPVDDRGEQVVTVQEGDYLSKIAEEELGDSDAWPLLYEASRGKVQPQGLPKITDPDVIFAGQQVTVPEARPGQPPHERAEEQDGQQATPPARPNPDGVNRPDDGAEDAPAATPGRTTAPTPEVPAASTPSGRPTDQPGHDPSSPSAAAPTASESSASSPDASAPAAEPSGAAAPSPATATPQTAPVSSSPLSLRIVLGAGALLAAAITGALALRRTLQRRRRKPGETIAIASETSAAEAQLAAAAEPDGAARLDVALRTLAHRLVQQDADAKLPPLRAARIGTRTVEVLPEDLAQDPVAPFTSGQRGWWVLPAEAALLDDESALDVPAPYPGLVTIGSTDAGDLLLLNLAQVPALLLDGNPVHITEVCTSLALELGMSPWAADVEIITVGFGEDLPQLLPTARIAHMRQAEHALRDLSERLLEAHQMPGTQHRPYLLLCTSSLDADTAWQFADVIDKARAVPVTLIAPASTAASRFPEAESLNASPTGPQHLEAVGIDINLQRLEHAAYLQIATALQVSGQPSHPAAGPWQDVPDELKDSQQPESASPAASRTDAASIPASAAAADVSGEVFPALLAASGDPAGLPLLSSVPSTADAVHGTGRGTEARTLLAPAPSSDADATDTVTAAEGDKPQIAPVSPAEDSEEDETHDLQTPEIRVLGPVEVTGVDSTGHGPRMAQLAALLYFRPGRTADALCADMDPVSPWSTSTLNARMQGLRSSLGSDAAGNLYVPRRKAGEDPYQLAATVRCDWTRFLQLVEQALPMGPSGLPTLEKALALVRGKPFGGRPLPWAEPYAQEMITRITDVAHTAATYRIPPGPHHNLSAARKAVATGLDVDPTAELLYRDWMRLEAARGNRSGLHTAITRVQQVNRELDCSLELETTQLINELLKGTRTTEPRNL